MKDIVLRQTADYSKFRMHHMNRLVIEGGDFVPRKDLVASMKKHGFRMTQPVRCVDQSSGDMLIFDGHNRFLTAQYLGIPLWYMCFPKGYELTPLQDADSGKPWSIKDIAAAHAHTHPDFAEVFAYCEVTGIALQTAFSLFAGQSGSSGNCNPLIKSGAFVIKDRDLPWKVAAVVRAAAHHCDFAATKGFVSAVSKCMFAEGFDRERLIERINRRPDLLKKCGYERDYIALFEEIYNHNIRTERLYLVAETEKAMRSRSAAKAKG